MASTRLPRRLVLPALPVALAAPVAEAQIVYTDTGDLTITNGAIFIDFYYDDPIDGIRGSASTESADPWSQDIVLYFPRDTSSVWAYGLSSGSFAVNWPNRARHYSAGSLIPSSGSWYYAAYIRVYNPVTNWAFNTRSYLGVSLYHTSESPDLYGWVELTLTETSLTVHGFAMDLSGAPIKAGDTGITPVPEPATTSALAALLAGSAALYAKRRKRTA